MWRGSPAIPLGTSSLVAAAAARRFAASTTPLHNSLARIRSAAGKVMALGALPQDASEQAQLLQELADSVRAVWADATNRAKAEANWSQVGYNPRCQDDSCTPQACDSPCSGLEAAVALTSATPSTVDVNAFTFEAQSGPLAGQSYTTNVTQTEYALQALEAAIASSCATPSTVDVNTFRLEAQSVPLAGQSYTTNSAHTVHALQGLRAGSSDPIGLSSQRRATAPSLFAVIDAT